MSKQKSPQSEKNQPKNSLFDFLYVDYDRVGRVLSQVIPEGVLKTREALASKIVSNSGKTYAKGKIPLVAEGGGELSGEEIFTDEGTKIFDPTHTLPILLLDELESRDLLKRDKKTWGLASIALTSGKLHMMDWRAAKGAFGQDQNGIIAENVFTSINAFLFAPHLKIWMQTDPKYWMFGRSSFLTHGHNIAGNWTCLGVVDALPGKPEGIPQNKFPHGHAMSGMFSGIADAYSKVGRPDDFYAFDPILIFREFS